MTGPCHQEAGCLWDGKSVPTSIYRQKVIPVVLRLESVVCCSPQLRQRYSSALLYNSRALQCSISVEIKSVYVYDCVCVSAVAAESWVPMSKALTLWQGMSDKVSVCVCACVCACVLTFMAQMCWAAAGGAGFSFLEPKEVSPVIKSKVFWLFPPAMWMLNYFIFNKDTKILTLMCYKLQCSIFTVVLHVSLP